MNKYIEDDIQCLCKNGYYVIYRVILVPICYYYVNQTVDVIYRKNASSITNNLEIIVYTKKKDKITFIVHELYPYRVPREIKYNGISFDKCIENMGKKRHSVYRCNELDDYMNCYVCNCMLYNWEYMVHNMNILVEYIQNIIQIKYIPVWQIYLNVFFRNFIFLDDIKSILSQIIHQKPYFKLPFT